MNPRERKMVIGLLAVLLIGGGGFAGYTFVYEPLSDTNDAIAKLEDEIYGTDGLSDRAEAMRKTAAQAAIVKRQSLPLDTNVAKTQYNLLLERLLQQAKIEHYTRPDARILEPRAPIVPDLGNKKFAFTRLIFRVEMKKTDIWQLSDFLYEFYQLDLLHQITDISITRENKPNEIRSGLDVKLTIEAIILDGAEAKLSIFPVLAGKPDSPILTSSGKAIAAIAGGRALPAVAAQPELARRVTAMSNSPVLATRPRDYSLLAARDIFYGLLPEKPPPGLTFAKIGPIKIKPDEKKIPDVKVSLSGEGAENARITVKSEGSMIPEGPLKFDPKTNTISFPPVNEGLTQYAHATVSLAAITDNGKEGKATFEVEFEKEIYKPKKDDISADIRLVLVSTTSDGSMTALIQDNASPFNYKITTNLKSEIIVDKLTLSQNDKRMWEWKKLETYKQPPGVLAISDDTSGTKRTLKVIAFENDSLIVQDLDPDGKADAKGAKGFRPPGGGFPGAKAPSGPSNPLPALVGNVPLAVPTAQAKILSDLTMRVIIGNLTKPPTVPVLYRWVNGKSLQTLDKSKLPPDEAARIYLSATENGSMGIPVSTAK